MNTRKLGRNKILGTGGWLGLVSLCDLIFCEKECFCFPQQGIALRDKVGLVWFGLLAFITWLVSRVN
jgi:hypothetical protein